MSMPFPLAKWSEARATPATEFTRSDDDASPETFAWAVEYVCTKMPMSVDGAGGSAVCMSVARMLRDGFMLSREQTAKALATWNETRADGPWSAKELRHKLKSVDNSPPTQEPGWMIPQVRAEREFRNIPNESEHTSEVESLPVRTHDDRLRDLWEPRPELVDGALPADGLAAFVALPGVGKSLTLLHLGTCVAGGTDFAGRKVMKGRVLYGCPDSSASTERRMLAIPGEIADRILTIPNFPSMPQSIPRLRATILAENAAHPGDPVRLVAIDTWDASRRHADTGYAGQDGLVEGIMSKLRSLASELHVACVVAHHATRADHGRARGSVVFDARCDLIACVEQPEEGKIRIVAIKNRDGEQGGLGVFLIQSHDVNGQSVPVLRWAGECPMPKPGNAGDMDILQWVVDHPDKRTAAAIVTGLGLTSKSQVANAAERLRRQGFMVAGRFAPTPEGISAVEGDPL